MTRGAGLKGSAVPTYCKNWQDETTGLPGNLSRSCRAHNRGAGRRPEVQIKIGCWRFEIGASHDKCPRCQEGVDSAAHAPFECSKVALEVRGSRDLLQVHGRTVSSIPDRYFNKEVANCFGPAAPTAAWDGLIYTFLEKVAREP